MKKRFSEEQIIKAMKSHEAGNKVEDICREGNTGHSQKHAINIDFSKAFTVIIRKVLIK